MKLRRIKTLAAKDLARLVRNRGAVTMAILLCAAALLIAVIGRGPVAAGSRPLRICSIDYWQDGPWIEHLRRNVPREIPVRFRLNGDIPTDRNGVLQYETDEGAIQVRVEGGSVRVWSWYPGDDPAVLAPFEDWFWRESERFFHSQTMAAAPPERRGEVERLVPPPIGGDAVRLRQALHRQYREQLRALAPDAPAIPEIAVERSSLRSIDLRQALTIALVYFATFFVCVCLHPSMTCEERERGVLQAQLLTPATAGDILVSKALAFIPLSAGLAWLVGGLTQPAVFGEPFFAAAVFVASLGAFAFGTTIAVLARTQRAASLAAMGYALAVALIVFGSQRSGFTALSQPFLEYHMPPLFRAAFDGVAHWQALGVAGLIVATWTALAAAFAVVRGWK